MSSLAHPADQADEAVLKRPVHSTKGAKRIVTRNIGFLLTY
jgi:hypothetical protein